MSYSIEHLLHIDAAPAKVYQAVTTVDGYKGWWTKECYGDFKVGGDVHFDFGDRYKNTFRVKYLDPDHRAVFQCIESVPEWIDTSIDIRLSLSENGTTVRFTHSGYSEADDFFAHCNYSWGYYLKSLKDLCEKGEGTPGGHQ